jgi:hypothetical protein
VNCDKRTNVNPSHEQEERAAALLAKYGEKTLTNLQLQKELYWLLTDKIIPSRHNFCAKITEKHEQDWKKIDRSKLYIQACMESFQWRSAHGKLCARRDLVRFNYIQEANCIYCYEPQQTIEHLYTECGRTQILFKNFKKKHFKHDTELTWCKKMIGMDTNVPQHKATHKRLGILRKLIYSYNHERRVPRWDDMLADVDRHYLTEFGIAERQGRVFRVLKDWNL